MCYVTASRARHETNPDLDSDQVHTPAYALTFLHARRQAHSPPVGSCIRLLSLDHVLSPSRTLFNDRTHYVVDGSIRSRREHCPRASSQKLSTATKLLDRSVGERCRMSRMGRVAMVRTYIRLWTLYRVLSDPSVHYCRTAKADAAVWHVLVCCSCTLHIPLRMDIAPVPTPRLSVPHIEFRPRHRAVVQRKCLVNVALSISK